MSTEFFPLFLELMIVTKAVSLPKRIMRRTKHYFVDPEGNKISLKGIDKVYRDVLINHLGTYEEVDKTGKVVTTTTIDVDNPLRPCGTLKLDGNGPVLQPSATSPICRKCKLDELNAKVPYFSPEGPDRPLITIVMDSVSIKEDARGKLAIDGPAGFLAKIIDDMSKETGVTSNDIRWSPLTRCASRIERSKLKSRGNHCRNFLVQDLADHPPKVIVPVGTTALGALCHKSSAQDWGGYALTYRGWPDDWLSNPKFMTFCESDIGIGHPLFGGVPSTRVPMIPLQSPHIIYGTQNPQVILRWKNQLKSLLLQAKNDSIQPLNFVRPWYHITDDPNEVEQILTELIDNPGTVVSYDTETNGLRPWKEGSVIVFMMFRWRDKKGNNRSLGFPWKYDGSPLFSHISRLSPTVLEALYRSSIVAHNGTFDALFTIANVEGCDLNRLAPQFKWDTWHMAYTMQQRRGTLSLDMLAYKWVPDLAGYEEDMTLLIDLHKDSMHPDSGQHAHYANCPKDKWDTHLKPYVMGDVEVCYVAREKINERLKELKTYNIPLAHPTKRGKFREYTALSRANVYDQVISPASRVLIKCMARGMHVDVDELTRQEDMYPKQLREMRDELRQSNQKIVDWCDAKESTVPGWEFDLEKKEQLQEILFDVLGLPVERLTDAGVKKYGEKIDDTIPKEELLKFAKVDKFTLNRIAAGYPQIRPLQQYRKAFKAYSSYVRPIRNVFAEGFDKKERTTDPHLARDGCVHAQFLLTGTRSGRLSSVNPNLQQLPSASTIKRIYCSRFGDSGAIYQGDLSQIELRLIAAACGDEAMVNAYRHDIDLHSLSMSKIFNLPYEQCVKDYVIWLQKKGKEREAKDMDIKRRTAKTINFLTGYGGGAHGLQATLAGGQVYFELDQCERFLDAFFDAYPALKLYLGYYKQFISDKGVAVSILGRVRVFEEVFSDNYSFINKALRAGCNHLIQATASDMMLICLCVIEGLMRDSNLESMLVSTVHDSLVIDAKVNELQQVHEIVMGVFNNIPDVLRAWFTDDVDLSWLIVPFGGDCEVGLNYLDMHRLPNKLDIDWDAVMVGMKSH